MLAQEAIYRVMLDSIGEGLVGTDEHENITFVNKAMENLLGIPSAEAIGKALTEIVPLQDEMGNTVPDYLRPSTLALTQSITVRKHELFCVRKDTTTVPVHVIAAPVMSNGKTIGVITSFHNRTKEVELEMAEDEFVSIAAHQLRTPLGTMRWHLERLLAGKDTTQVKEILTEMYTSNLHLISLVNDLLIVTQINQNRIQVHPQETNILPLITEVIYQFRDEIQIKSLSVTVSPAQSIPDLFLDPQLFRQVMQNLFSNAIKYNKDHGSIAIDLVCRQAGLEKKEHDILLKITDTGIGIPKKDIKKIFEKFHRAANSNMVAYEGSGIGLFLVQSFVKYWRGKVWAESIEGKGTTIFLTIPIT